MGRARDMARERWVEREMGREGHLTIHVGIIKYHLTLDSRESRRSSFEGEGRQWKERPP